MDGADGFARLEGLFRFLEHRRLAGSWTSLDGLQTRCEGAFRKVDLEELGMRWLTYRVHIQLVDKRSASTW
jgi:hypothetical protein